MSAMLHTLRRLGIEARRFRLLHRRADTHWLVHGEAPFQRVIVRQFHPRYGGPSGSESRQWEQTLADTLARSGWPVPRLLKPHQLVDGRWYGIYEVRQGKPVSKDEQGYFWLGQQLARLHLTMESIDLDERLTRQRPGWGSSTEGDRPRFGLGDAQDLIGLLETIDSNLAARLAQESDRLRLAVAVMNLTALPLGPIHGDFVPWNLRQLDGRISALYDFDMSHLDCQLADLAAARRGHHDRVVDGYASVKPLSDEAVDALPVLWRGAVLSVFWENLAHAAAEPDSPSSKPGAYDWARAQLEKIHPYQRSGSR